MEMLHLHRCIYLAFLMNKSIIMLMTVYNVDMVIQIMVKMETIKAIL